jgi:L-fuculose-phosphate aldolase
MAAKEEMSAVGRKLWRREYVDGNGGNISFRISDDFVLCSPTLKSKGDLTPADICMVDMAGNQVAGTMKMTSEIKLHLEIYKHQPKAKACVHAHPVHATAYSIVGKIPPACVIPEAEIFIGLVALADYETPGTREMAEKVIPLCQDHNTILLANHGLICWSDNPTHAEWLVEVVDNYCRTLILANQLGAPITRITSEQSRELMEVKKKLDLPDPRISGREAMLCDLSDSTTSIIVEPRTIQAAPPAEGEVDALVAEITDRVMKALGKGEGAG